MRGTMVTFEGCDGVGKSTQLRLLKEYLLQTGQEAVFVREPGGTKISEQIRSIIMSVANAEMTAKTETLLYAASRAQLVDEVIRPALNEGKLVICDRFIDSSIAYQGGARGVDVDWVKSISAFATDNLKVDLTVFIDLPPTDAFRTVKKEDRLEDESSDFHKRVYRAYIGEAEREPHRIVRITPCIEKLDTHHKILNVLREKGIIH